MKTENIYNIHTKSSPDDVIQVFDIVTEQDVIDYIYWLEALELLYHWDDNPISCLFNGLTEIEQLKLQVNHERVWQSCNPWELMETHPELCEVYGIE
jgi:hypothetical protein